MIYKTGNQNAKQHTVTIDGRTKNVTGWCEYLDIVIHNAYASSKKLKITIDDYLRFKYFNPGGSASAKNMNAFLNEQEAQG